MKYAIPLACLLLFLLASTVRPAPRADEWEAVEEAMAAGLPRTAIEHLEPILGASIEDGAHAEAVRAVGVTIALEGAIEGNRPEEKIPRLEARMPELPDAMQPLLHAILGHWYWEYFQRNRWRFLERTRTAEPPGEDFTTWDLDRILAEIDRHFTAALADREALRAVPIGEFDALLEEGTVPDSYRPTLYDFLAHEALAFYAAGEQGAVRAEDPFVLTADSPVFSPREAFLDWEPEAANAESVTLKAIRLYRELLAHHAAEGNRAALLDADLQRLRFGYNTAVGSEKNARYREALERFVAEHGDHEISARARFHWAGVLGDEEKFVEARRIAGLGAEEHPDSIGGVWCANLIQEIEAKSAQMTTESVWTEPWPDLQVTYRNVEAVYFRAIPYDFETFLEEQRLGRVSSELMDSVRSEEPTKIWRESLPPTDDYRERTEALPVPDDLEPGFYLVLASHDPDFRTSDNQVSFAPVWVSELAILTRQRRFEDRLEGFLLEAQSGEPVPGARVRLLTVTPEGELERQTPVRTDREGRFRVQPHRGQYLILAEHDGRQVATGQEYWYFQRRGTPDPESTVFFTDRSLFRPGQTIHYKGISFHADADAAAYRTLDGRSVTVALLDPNGQEVSRRTHRTNDFGSFSGSFPAPEGRITGRMTLRVVEGPGGRTSVNVEEYKRPKFRAELDPPEEAARLGEEVTLEGRATAYTGASVGGASVRWRVVREVRFPPWCWWGPWRWGPGGSESGAIAHGTGETDRDGTFTVSFPARPDPAVPESDEPAFVFTVHAEITDTTGETRSASRSVRAGYTALRATLHAEEWQVPEEPVVLTVTTASLDDDPEPAQGTVFVHSLRQPERPVREPLEPVRPLYRIDGDAAGEPGYDPANPDTWEADELVGEQTFRTGPTGAAQLEFDLPPGIYRASLETADRFGKTVTARRTIRVVDPVAEEFPITVTSSFSAPQWTIEPGDTFVALWGTGYESGRAFVEVERAGEILQEYWTDPDRTQERIEQEVTEEMRGGFTVRVTHVRENRAYLHERIVDVPWGNKEFSVRWERFRSDLEPGTEETWTAVIEGPDAETAAAEMVAALYDASLDQYLPHEWPEAFHGFRSENPRMQANFHNRAERFQHLAGRWRVSVNEAPLVYRHFPREIVGSTGGMGYDGYFLGSRVRATARRAVATDDLALMPQMMQAETVADVAELRTQAGAEPESDGTPDLDTVSLRENLNETAFFFPHLTSGDDGTVRMEFTLPEALTEWRFLGFAHDADLRSGFLTDTAVSSKELMVEPLAPRFVREGDVIEFPVKVSNESAARRSGSVRLTLLDAETLDPRDAELDNMENEKQFDIPSKESRTYLWRIRIPEGAGFLVYRAAGAAERLSDGEEGYLPVLSRRIPVTESLPLPVRGRQTKTFEFEKLLTSGNSETLQNQALTVQMASQPAWYAVLALPYLMEFPYECSEQVFNRLYANALARHIANSDPKIRRIFDLWKNTLALDSPMEKNEDLKSVMLEETPWLRQARSESEARRRVGVLFDDNRLDDETARALRRLGELQRPDGFWPWFPGGPENEYITLYLTTGFARLRHLGADIDLSLAETALGALDAHMNERYERIRAEGTVERNHFTPFAAFYLYGRSFYLDRHPVDRAHREAIDFWLDQAREHWLAAGRQSQAHTALGLRRFGDRETAVAIMASIRERAVTDEEMGMYWRDLEQSWWWYRAPIETQALMIEAFDEILGDTEAVEACRVWLLKQKQTQDWKTTRATADAVYGILLRGSDVLGSNARVEVALGGEAVDPGDVEPGTGFYEARFVRDEIRPEMGEVTVTKTDDGVSWGSVHWQYLEAVSEITPHEGTPLELRKHLFMKETTGRGQELTPVEGPLAVGDELVVRLDLRVDRDMEYVHLKDQRGSGTEPVNVLSRHRYQDGLRYYESTRDTASHFFIEYLPRGVYVFEYSTHIRHRGAYQSGIATIQCMYAPEFNSHSESFGIEVE